MDNSENVNKQKNKKINKKTNWKTSKKNNRHTNNETTKQTNAATDTQTTNKKTSDTTNTQTSNQTTMNHYRNNKFNIDDKDYDKKKNTQPVLNKNIFIPNSKYFTIMIYCLLCVTGSILIYKFIGNFGHTLIFISNILKLLSPFLIGLLIAFILYPLVKFIYDFLLTSSLKINSEKIKKWISIFLAYVIAIGAIAILMIFIIPQIYQSISEITEQLPIWYSSALNYINKFEEEHSELDKIVNFTLINDRLNSAIPIVFDYLTNMITNLLPIILTTSMAIVKGVISFIISIMVSVYMISDHHNLSYHGKRFLYAFLPKKTAATFISVLHESCKIFMSFIFGKALDSFIIGIMCFILMLIFRFPYAVLISVVVGVSNMIPYFGPYIGGVIGFLFILISSPVQALFFALLILVLQQFDGLFLGPKILGDKTGLKPIWVIFGITIGGSLFGVIGMFLGVPCVAVISYILHLIITHFLKKKNIEIKPYDNPDHI